MNEWMNVSITKCDFDLQKKKKPAQKYDSGFMW